MSNGNKNDMDALRDNIEHTRQRISGELEAIGERLTPGHAREVARDKMVEAKDRAVENVRGNLYETKDRAISRAREGASYARDRAADVPRIVRENPVPTAMVLVGTGMLAYYAIRRSRQPSIEVEIEREPIVETETIGAGVYGYEGVVGGEDIEVELEGGSTLGDRARSAREAARGRMESAKRRLSGTAGSVKERAGHLARQGRGRSQDLYENNPLALGAVCFFAGIGLGMLLPHTRREDDLLGDRRQRLLDRAKHAAQDAKDVAIHSAKEGIKTARETAKHDAENRDLMPR